MYWTKTGELVLFAVVFLEELLQIQTNCYRRNKLCLFPRKLHAVWCSFFLQLFQVRIHEEAMEVEGWALTCCRRELLNLHLLSAGLVHHLTRQLPVQPLVASQNMWSYWQPSNRILLPEPVLLTAPTHSKCVAQCRSERAKSDGFWRTTCL